MQYGVMACKWVVAKIVIFFMHLDKQNADLVLCGGVRSHLTHTPWLRACLLPKLKGVLV